MATKKNTQLVKDLISQKLDKNNKNNNLDIQVDENGRLIYNEFGEQTTLTTDGIKFFKFRNKFSHLDSVLLYVMSDTHVASEESQVEKIERYIQQIHNDPRGVLALNGDLINFAIKDSVSDPYTQKYSILESIERIEKMVEQMDSEGRIIANLWGNHDGNRSAKLVAITPVTKYVKNPKLAAPAIAVIELELKSKFKVGETVTLTIMLQHGEAAKGGPLGTVQSAIQLAIDIFNAVPDVVAMGHTHQNAGASTVVFMPDVNSEKYKKALRAQKNIETIKKRIHGYAISAGITTEVYALKKGYKLANTDGYVVEAQQVQDGNSFYWDTNTIDLDKAYSLQNMIKGRGLTKLRKAQMQLRKEKRKYDKLVKEVALDEHAKLFGEFKEKNEALAADVVQKYDLADELVKRINK